MIRSNPECSGVQAKDHPIFMQERAHGMWHMLDRCQVKAITEEEGMTVVNLEECIGCGLCATGCPNDAARIQRKPEEEIIHPPEDFATWEKERIISRGLNK